MLPPHWKGNRSAQVTELLFGARLSDYHRWLSTTLTPQRLWRPAWALSRASSLKDAWASCLIRRLRSFSFFEQPRLLRTILCSQVLPQMST